MSDNTIFDEDTNDTIGYYKDLKALLVKQAHEFIDTGDYEMCGDTMGVIVELDEYDDYAGLLRLSDNNGMGYTIREYKGE